MRAVDKINRNKMAAAVGLERAKTYFNTNKVYRIREITSITKPLGTGRQKWLNETTESVPTFSYDEDQAISVHAFIGSLL